VNDGLLRAVLPSGASRRLDGTALSRGYATEADRLVHSIILVVETAVCASVPTIRSCVVV